MIRSAADEIWPADGRPEHLRAACHASLRRLRLERIDLYQLHTVDPAVPIEESVGALAELQAEGKIRLIGVSNVDADEVERARSTVAIAAVQNRYSIAYRHADDVIEICEREGLAFLAWRPLFVGWMGERLARVGSPDPINAGCARVAACALAGRGRDPRTRSVRTWRRTSQRARFGSRTPT